MSVLRTSCNDFIVYMDNSIFTVEIVWAQYVRVHMYVSTQYDLDCKSLTLTYTYIT